MLSNLLQDLRYAARHRPSSLAFTAAAIVTIALGVGANAAIFGVAKSVLLDSLPYTDADQLVQVYGGLRDDPRWPGSADGGHDRRHRRAAAIVLASVAAFRPSPSSDAVFGSAEGPRVAQAAWVEPWLFDHAWCFGCAGPHVSRLEDAANGYGAS